MKFKLGDIVTIKKSLRNTNKSVGVTPQMEKCCGKSAKVVCVTHSFKGFPVVRLDVCRQFVWEYDSFEEGQWD